MNDDQRHIAESLDLLRRVGCDTDRLPLLLHCESGDVIQIDASPSGVLITIDDSDDSPLPTVRIEPHEAYRLITMLLRCAKRVERSSSDS